MRSYQFFKNFQKLFDKERGKTLVQQPIRKQNLRKAGPCFITGCSVKPLNMIINQFFISQAHLQPNFVFVISG